MGDAPALIVEAQLQRAQPYPGDDLEEPVMEDHRFELVQIPEKENVYLINDLRHDSFDDPAGYSIEINKEQLLDPEFNCPKWYADQLVEKLFPHVPQSNARDYHPRIYDFCMGDVYLDMLAHRLKLAVHIFPAPINQPDDEQEALSRFHFERREHTCFIIDYGEHTLTEISVDLLAKPQFRILQWYEKRIIEKRRARKIVQPAYFSSEVVRDYTPIGDVLAISAAEILALAEPYPGDTAAYNRNRRRRLKERRFQVKRVSKSHYMIKDSLRRTESFILTKHLRTPGFTLPKWYAEECERQDMSSPSVLHDRFHCLVNGDTLANAAASSPLPNIEGILRRIASKVYWSLMDMKDAFEQIRIIPEHVPRTAVTTPDGTMVSMVIQQGDCNAPATCQALMNHIFAAYLGVWMDVYLDDIIIYSSTLEEHVEHVKIVIDILTREKFYLSKRKLQLLCKKLKVLGHVIDADGIHMDPAKISSVLAWKVPTNRDLLRGFLGSVGYLADDLVSVRVPMGVLTALTGDTVPFRWDFTHQRAFEQIKQIVANSRSRHRVPLNYSADTDPIYMVTDGCATGVSGLVSQGKDWRGARVAAFYSAKLNSAQQNYAVHEIEMFAGVETMLRHRNILQGIHFKWITDHKWLIHLLNQKDLTGWQARWLDKISEFDFEVIYVPGAENILADALSRIYSNDAPGTVRSEAEYTQHNDSRIYLEAHGISAPLLAGLEAVAERRPRARKVLPPAETGRPETGAEFARRVKDHFVLLGPGVQKEGAGGTKSTTPDIQNPSELGGTPSTTPSTQNRAVGSGTPSTQSHAGGVGTPSTQQPSNSVLGAQTSKSAQNATSDQQSQIKAPTAEARDSASALATHDQTDMPDDEFDSSIPDTSLIEAVSGGRDSIDLLEAIKNKYIDDPFFKNVAEHPREFKNFEVTKGGLVYLKIQGRKLVCIPKVTGNGRNVREIVISEAHSLLAHLGTNKTLDYLRDHVWWKEMVNDTRIYCETCQTCKQSKPANQKPYGLLNPLPIPAQPWDSIGVDFIGPLPESKNRDGIFDSITVVIDLLTAMVHLIPSRTDYNAQQIAELMFEHVYKLHGLPKYIISDRDVLFTCEFWQHLHKLIGTKLKMSSAYHPQTDGSTERANRTVTQMLRQCIGPDQRDWVAKLPAVEFAINSAQSESTGFAPFFLNAGRMPRSMIWESSGPDEYPGVRNFALQRKLALMQAHDSILAARVKQTHDANKRRRMSPFVTGDLCYVSTKNISFPKGYARKLVPKYIGPYKILEDFGNYSYRIELPTHLKQRGVHDVYHASLLRIHIPNDDRLFPGRLDTQLGNQDTPDGKWAVERIEGHVGARTDAIFKMRWKSGDVTWMPYYQIAVLSRPRSDTVGRLGSVKDVKKVKKVGPGQRVHVKLLY
jgi:RNase H-like domain found in reverse transcriptase/Reverse transcriptase (RNA-dependent DNA polymerase)/Integrase zinc binding domain